MHKSAELSVSKLHRYTLERVWDTTNAARMIFIMLNPSTADHEVNDPTITRCIGFGQCAGVGGIIVLNLFTYRTPSPDVLQAAGFTNGPVADKWIDEVLTNLSPGSMVVCAWGANARRPEVGARATQVLGMLARHGVNALALALTKDGHPRHPLYLPKSSKPQPLP